MGGKGKLLWLINKLAPSRYAKFVDVFGGSGTVTLNRPLRRGCIEIYNDFNSNLTNLFCCVKERTMALLRELGFLPLNSRDDFDVLYKFFSRQEFTDDYLEEELELTQVFLEPPQAEAVRRLMLERAPRGDLRRAADYFKLVRYSFSGNTKAFAGKPCDIRRFFHLIWECARRLKNVVVENKDFEKLTEQYDRENTFFYCDPPYFGAECYEVEFSQPDHIRLHDALTRCKGYVMVSYNYCSFICELYRDFYIFRTKRPNSMSLKPDSEYEEVVMTNYDPRLHGWQISFFQAAEDKDAGKYQLIHELLQLAAVDMDSTEFDGEIGRVSSAILDLLTRKTELEREGCADPEYDSRVASITGALEETDSAVVPFDDAIVRQVIGSIRVLDRERLSIRFKDGTEVEQTIEYPQRRVSA